MNRKQQTLTQIVALAVLIIATGGMAAGQTGGEALRSLDAYAPLVIGDVFDPFRYDGEDVRPLLGSATLSVDPKRNVGTLIANVRTTDLSGPIVVAEGVALEGWIQVVMERFYGPQEFMSGGIAETLRMHGDTGLMSPRMPEVDASLVGWGYMDIYLNGALLYEGVPGHFMVTERVRRGPELGYEIVRDSDGTIYSLDLEDKTGFVFSRDHELHLWASSSLEGFESPISAPFFLHLNMQVDGPIVGAGGSSVTESNPPTQTPEDPSPDPDNGGPKGNNGIGNGVDPQPPGNPPINDGEGKTPGGGKK